MICAFVHISIRARLHLFYGWINSQTEVKRSKRNIARSISIDSMLTLLYSIEK